MSSCEKDQKLLLEGAFFNLDDNNITSIQARIPYVNTLSFEDDGVALLCNVSVFDQNNFPVFDLTVSNFELYYRYMDEEGGFICLSNYYIGDDEEPTPSATVITMDYSGSMSNSDIAHMEEAVIAYVNNLGENDMVQIIKFASYVQAMNDFTNDRDVLMQAINEPFNRGMTAFYDAVYLGLENLQALLEDGRFTPLVIAFTDGYDNYSQFSLSELLEFAENTQVPVYTVGLGHIDESILTTIAVITGGFFQYTVDASDITNLFFLIHEHINNLYKITAHIHNGEGDMIEIKVRVFYENANGSHTAEAQHRYRIES